MSNGKGRQGAAAGKRAVPKSGKRVWIASTATKSTGKASEEILACLKRLAPPMSRISVESPDPSKNMLFLPLDRVCYITSKTDSDREDEAMFVTVEGERFYNAMSLKAIEELLAEGNPWFLRTSKYYLIHLGRVTAFRYNSARDLWFQGLADPVENAVSESYLAEFNARIGI